VPSRWFYIRYMPRNNFLSQPRPVPVCQGFHWDYSDFYCWEDDRMPKQWHYRNFTGRRSDLHWTINQVCFDATLMEEPGAVKIQMGTFTPYFETFLTNVDAQGWQTQKPSFVWRLHPGKNRLEMRVRNTSGVTGPISFVELEN
jgi:hypothetical protein